MQHLQQDNVKVGAAGDRAEQQEQQLQLLQGEVQHLQQDNVKVEAAGDRDSREARATAAAGEKSKERDAEFGEWCRNEAL